jgi:hypothetical protein
MSSMWGKWTREEEVKFVRFMISAEGIQGLVNPPKDPILQNCKLRRNLGFFREVAKVIKTKTSQQCKSKLQKIQPRFLGRHDLLELDIEPCIDFILD